MASLRFSGPGEVADMAAFLSRAVRLDRSTLVRLRTVAGSTTAYLRLPFGVLVSRSARIQEAPADVTVSASALLAALDAVGDDSVVTLPDLRDAEWRGQLPPAVGWDRLDHVPVEVVARLVRAGAEAYRAAGPGAAASVGESLLDRDALTVSGGGSTAGLPLRVLSAAWRMGFLGEEPPAPDVAAIPDPPERLVAVSASAGWVRLAAPYGSAYHRIAPVLVLRPT